MLKALIVAALLSMGFVMSPVYLACILLIMSVALVAQLCMAGCAWSALWTWLVYLSGVLVLLLFVCALSPSPAISGSAWVWGFLISALCALAQATWDTSASEPVMLVFFGGTGPHLFIWVACLLFILIVTVAKLSPQGFLKNKLLHAMVG